MQLKDNAPHVKQALQSVKMKTERQSLIVLVLTATAEVLLVKSAKDVTKNILQDIPVKTVASIAQ